MKNNISNIDIVVDTILIKDYKEPLGLKSIPEDLEESEKNFYSRWINKSVEVEDIKLESCNKSINYIKVTAFCEFSTRRVLDPNSGNLLPKKDRLNTALIDCLFVQQDNDVYLVVCTNNFYDLRRVRRLIGDMNLEPLTSKHHTSSDLFHWLFYKYIKDEVDLNSEIKMDNINGFTGTVINEDHLFEGKSIQTAELIITKAFITNGYPITSLKIDLQMPDAAINFYLSEVSEGKELKIVVEKNSSTSILFNNEDTEYILPIYIFFYLIPKIIDIYKEDEKDFLSSNKLRFLSEIGIEVIKTIMAKNNLTLADIE